METEADVCKRLILKIIQAYGRRLDGKTRLFKTYYFAHLEYFKATGRTLTDGTIAHFPHGPGIRDFDGFLTTLQNEKRVKETRSSPGSYIEFTYELLTDAPLADSAEDRAVHKAVRITEGFTATQLSNMSHVISHSWKRTEDGDLMDICVDAASAADLERMAKRLEAAKKIAKAFNA